MRAGAFLITGASVLLVFRAHSAPPPKPRDPGAWGGDHVRKPVPEFVAGDECLFCHRKEVGNTWQNNRHNMTVRRAEPDAPELDALKKSPALRELVGQVEFLMGGKRGTRYLKPAAAYGQLDLLSTSGRPHWDAKQFADGCAGCHCTAVNRKTRAFSAVSLDCYTCHGDVSLMHTKDGSLAYLSKKRNDSAAAVTSVCAQCHVRTGTSRSTGLPYANNFVAGDNLFRDFQVDLAPETIRGLNPADAHVIDNVRSVAVLGKEDVTCLSCHDVHAQSSKKHHRVEASDYCLHCHNATGPKKVVKSYEVHSRTCGY